MVTSIKTLLNEVEGTPSPERMARIYLKYDGESTRPHWGPYPRMSFQPKFLSPDVSSELIVYRGEPEPLLRLAPALETTMRARPQRYRVLCVPNDLKHVANMVSGVSDTVVIPPQPSVSSLLKYFSEEFSKQSFQRIINCSSDPAGAWLAGLARQSVETGRAEGVFFNGVTPTLTAGPGVLLYHNWLLQNRETESPPVRHGAFEGLMFGDGGHRPDLGLSPGDSDRKAAEDFRNGLQHPRRPLCLLVPPRDGTKQAAEAWAQWANRFMDRENKDVVLFGDRTEHDFHRDIERELNGHITFADRWLPNPRQKSALVNLSEAVVTGRKLEMLLSVRQDTPVVFLNDKPARDVMNPGDVLIRTDGGCPDAVDLAAVYEQAISGEVDTDSLPEPSREYEIEDDWDHSTIFRDTTKFPRRSVNDQDFKSFVLKLCEYRVWYVVNRLVGFDLPDLNKPSVLSALQANFGDRRFGRLASNVLKDIRGDLNSLEQSLASEITGVDTSPPDSLSSREERWMTILDPLWTFRSAAEGEEKTGKILWGFRYFFSKCKKILQFIENS